MKDFKHLLQSATNAMHNAYAPYSNFKVGAVIVDEKHAIHAGCNVENSAYPLGTCAEAAALSAMVLSGAKTIKKILLVSSGQHMVTPCGGCRQKIAEFADEDTEIIIFHKEKISTFKLDTLLPFCFDKKHLEQ